MVMARNGRFYGEHYGNVALETGGESEGSGSSGRLDLEIVASRDLNVSMKKCIFLNPNKRDSFGVPIQVLQVSSMPPVQRKDVLNKLRFELERTRLLQKRVDLLRMNGVSVSSSSDILSCSNGPNGERETVRKSSGQVKKDTPSSISAARGWNRGTTGKFECAQPMPLPNTANAMLMKQCEALLKRLMSHQYGWVFNTPVDVVKLNIPDYFTVIKHPMDLGTIKQKIASGMYSSPLEFFADVRLTFKNAMTYNPPGNDVYLMADTLSKFFELRWKPIEKKLQVPDVLPLPTKSGPHEELESTKSMPPCKKRKVASVHLEVKTEHITRAMTNDEKLILGTELQPLLCEMPERIIDFLREHGSSNGGMSGEDEIEIDIDINELSDDTLFTLRKLVDDYLQEKQKNQGKAEPCEIELLHEPGLSNSSMPPCKDDDPVDEDVDIIGGSEPPVSSYPTVEIEKDADHRSSKCFSPINSSGSIVSGADNATASSPVTAAKETLDSGSQFEDKTGDPIERNQSGSALDQLEQTSQQKSSSVESDCCQDGAFAQKPVSPDRLYRAAVLKNRFADIILKAREKNLSQGEKKDPEKLRKEREELEMQRRKEKARLQAEAKAAEEARRRAEAEAAAEAAAAAKRKRELEREAARQALLQIEKTVEINENSRFLEDLEMLRAPVEQLPSSVDETSPEHDQDVLARLGSFSFGGSNPLEQLGLYMKMDEEEEECDLPSIQNPINEVEEEEECDPPSIQNPINEIEEEEEECEKPSISLTNPASEAEDEESNPPPSVPSNDEEMKEPESPKLGKEAEDGECNEQLSSTTNAGNEVEEGEID